MLEIIQEMYKCDLSREKANYPLIDQIFRCLIMKKLLSFPIMLLNDCL